MFLRWYLILILIGLAIYALVGLISYAGAKHFDLPKEVPVVLIVFVPGLILGMAAALNVGGYFR
jgi:hypothetical protein